MNSAINYDALPLPEAPGSYILKEALIITGIVVLVLATLLVFVFLFHASEDQVSSVFDWAEFLTILIGVPLILLGVVHRLRMNLLKYNARMHQFATDNNWSFEGSPYLDSGLNFLRHGLKAWPGHKLYSISGSVNGTQFELYAVQTIMPSMSIRYRFTLGYSTTLKVNAPDLTGENLPARVHVEEDGQYTNISIDSNATTRSNMQLLFSQLFGD